jgi:hypothetical protein
MAGLFWPRTARLVAVLAGLSIVGSARALAQGGPPMITDDPDTPGPGFWEVNVSVQSDSSRTDTRLETPRVDANYGVGDRIQLKFEVPWVQALDGVRRQGPGDATAGVKWRFLGQEGMRLAWSVYPQVEFNTARSSVNKELVDAGPDFQLPTEITLEIHHVEINGEVGRTFIVRGAGSWIAGLSTEVQPLQRLELLAELHAEATRRQPSEWIANVGARPRLTERLTLLMAAGHTTHTGRGKPSRILAYAGVQLNLPGRYAPP